MMNPNLFILIYLLSSKYHSYKSVENLKAGSFNPVFSKQWHLHN